MSKPLLVADGLTKHYTVNRGFLKPKATLKAVDGVSFDLSAGQTVAVVGESGSGKSTLARLLTMIEQPTGGTLEIVGKDAAHPGRADAKELRRAVQMIFQDPYGSLNPRKKIGTILEESVVINTDMPAKERKERGQALLSKVGLRSEHYHRYPHMFSGGQRQRIAIARALMLNPRILVADEPVSALDVSVQAQVLNLMMDLQEEFNLAYLFISHDLSVVRHIADEVLVLYLGKPVEQGSKETLFERPRHPYTRALLGSTPSVDPAHRTQRISVKGELPSPLNPPSGCAFRSRCPYATDLCKDERPPLRYVDSRMVACHYAETIS
ncbi:peptide ABC transporter ATP-binding protein [Inquilinus sp. CAU 1745]|uniref:peptide ABC transporter ATP-binding protein n=1 Tax=Inquilinus sp. CAU 1745 TaxID=3140369 RepID=UPI00325B49E9